MRKAKELIASLEDLRLTTAKRVQQLSAERQVLRTRDAALRGLVRSLEGLIEASRRINQHTAGGSSGAGGAEDAGASEPHAVPLQALASLREWKHALRPSGGEQQRQQQQCQGGSDQSQASSAGGGSRTLGAKSTAAAGCEGGGGGQGSNSRATAATTAAAGAAESEAVAAPAGGQRESGSNSAALADACGAAADDMPSDELPSWVNALGPLLQEPEIAAALEHGLTARDFAVQAVQYVRSVAVDMSHVINCAPDAAAAERRLRAANDRKWAVFALFLVKRPEALFQITLMDLGTLEPLIEPPNEDLWEYVVRQTKFTPQQGAITDCLAEMLCARSAAIQSELESLTRDQPDAHDAEAGELVLQRAEGLKALHGWMAVAASLAFGHETLTPLQIASMMAAGFPYHPSLLGLWRSWKRMQQQDAEPAAGSGDSSTAPGAGAGAGGPRAGG